MNTESEVVESAVLICRACLVETKHNWKRCQKCGGNDISPHDIGSPGEIIESSIDIARENPPCRPGARSSGFMQLI